jgi:hypothetical protein
MPDLNTIHADVTDWKYDTSFELPEIPEPSGLCYCALTDTIFVVDDGGPGRQSGLYEIDLDGNYKRGIQFGADLEGVTYCGANNRLYVADEKDETVHIVEPKELKVQGSFQVSRVVEGGKELLQAGGNGFEGIAWFQNPGCEDVAEGYLLLLNQDDPCCLVWVAMEDAVPGNVAPLLEYYMLPERNSGELVFDAGSSSLWVVNSWMNTCELLDLAAMPNVGAQWPVSHWEVLPGMAQEGLTFDPQGRMWIGQDIGGVVRYVKPVK